MPAAAYEDPALPSSRYWVLSLLAIVGVIGGVQGLHLYIMQTQTSSVGGWRSGTTMAKVSKNSGAIKQYETILINPNASIAEDVITIKHQPHLAMIRVQLRESARCPRPYLKGRLSGPALSVVQNWRYTTTVSGQTTKHEILGTYPTPLVAGTYFVELVVVFCDNFLLGSTTTTASNGANNTTTMPDSVRNNSYDFSQTCTEDATQRQLTMPDATITVTTNIQQRENKIRQIKQPPGFWINKKSQSQQSTSTNTTTSIVKPLPMRYQLPGCYRQATPKCLAPITSVEPFEDYTFQWTTSKSKNAVAYLASSSQPPTTICILGSSHARKMAEYLWAAQADNHNGTALLSPTITIQYHDVRMPFQVTVDFVSRILSGSCQRLVISVGQWPAGKKFRINRNGPCTVARFYQDYHDMVQRLHAAFPTVPTIYRSINYNPLGGLIGACPPSDWRSPTVVDGYNAAIEQVVQQVANNNSMVQFGDTDFLVGPMWDAASDWCHLDKTIGLLQGLYMVRQVLQMAP